jgi:hypothetical protein
VYRDTPGPFRRRDVLRAAGRGENVSVRLRPAVRSIAGFAAVLLAGGAAACGGEPSARPAPATSASQPADPADARVQLAALAALAQDHHFAALYHFDGGGPTRNVVATVANDGSWRVDIAGGALGGTTDVAIVSQAAGVFQCSLASMTNPITSTCVRVAEPGRRVPPAGDPKVERVFRQWLTVFTDRQAPLSVSAAQPLPGSQGSCYSVDSISASMSAPVDVGIYCYADNGLLTAAKVDFGTITIASAPVAPPAKVDLPGPIVDGSPLGMDSPSPQPPPTSAAAPAPSAVSSAPPD